MTAAPATYGWLSLAFLGVAALVAVLALIVAARRGARLRRAVIPLSVSAVVLVVLTAVFDNAMIAVGLMQYSAAHTSGLHIGAAPLEDFAYPIAGLILLPSLWVLFARGTRSTRGTGTRGAGSAR